MVGLGQKKTVGAGLADIGLLNYNFAISFVGNGFLALSNYAKINSNFIGFSRKIDENRVF